MTGEVTRVHDDGTVTIFVALKGSWNRVPPTGYKLERAKFKNDGAPAGWYTTSSPDSG